MMNTTKEINALFTLIDDPDIEVFNTVAGKLMGYGKTIIPNLEQLWENTPENYVQERIETIIHKLNFEDVKYTLYTLSLNKEIPLLDICITIARFRTPQLDEKNIRKTIKSIYQSCWLEINNYLTPLEKINIVNSIIYNMYKFKGCSSDENHSSNYFINDVIDSRKGNNFSLGIIYLIVCEMLDLPIFAIQLPQQFVLAYFNTVFDFVKQNTQPITRAQFFLEPNSGMIYSQQDVNAYLHKYKMTPNETTFFPQTNFKVISKLLKNLALAYELENDSEKANEIKELQTIIANA